MREFMIEQNSKLISIDIDEENGPTLRTYPPVNNIFDVFEVHDSNGDILRLNTPVDLDKTSRHENGTRDTRLGLNSDMKRFP